jgi:hypothetical protein
MCRSRSISLRQNLEFTFERYERQRLTVACKSRSARRHISERWWHKPREKRRCSLFAPAIAPQYPRVLTPEEILDNYNSGIA